MPPEAIHQSQCDPVKVLINSLNMIIANLDQCHEDENLEILSMIEQEIEKLPIGDSIKQSLCDILWLPTIPIGKSLCTIAIYLLPQKLKKEKTKS